MGIGTIIMIDYYYFVTKPLNSGLSNGQDNHEELSRQHSLNIAKGVEIIRIIHILY